MKEFVREYENRSLKFVFDDSGVVIKEEKDKKTIDYDEGEILHCFCPYERLSKIELKFDTLFLDFYYNDKKVSKFASFSDLNFFQKQSLKSAVNFAINKKKNASKPFKEVQVFDEIKGKFSDKDEHIMLCERCGHVYYFTDDALEYNNTKRQKAFDLYKTAATDALLYGPLVAKVEVNMAKDKLEDLDEYYECPKCKSEHIRRITEQELKEIIEKKNKSQATISQADELKKFKDLLDSGIITQEEFDAKKKQLLGL